MKKLDVEHDEKKSIRMCMVGRCMLLIGLLLNFEIYEARKPKVIQMFSLLSFDYDTTKYFFFFERLLMKGKIRRNV